MLTFSDFLMNKVVCETRYEQGHLYWDKTGETLRKIERDLSEWKWEKIEGGQTHLRNTSRKMKAFFSSQRLWIEQIRVDNLSQLKTNYDKLMKIILSEFEIKQISRIGVRYWFVLPCESVEETEKVISKGKIFDNSLEKKPVFGKKILTRDYALVIEGDDYKYRVSIAGVDRKPDPVLDKDKEFVLYNPLKAVLADIDVFKVASINVDDFVFSDFIQRAYKRIESNLMKLFR